MWDIGGDDRTDRPRTMKLTGIIEGILLVVLIDTGASNNFVSPTVVSMLGLNVNDNQIMGVKLGGIRY